MDLYWRERIRRLLNKLSNTTEKPPYYSVDEETQNLLEAALNLVAQTATLQINEDNANGLLDICDSIAERFGIDSHEIAVKDDTPDYEGGDSSITVFRIPRASNSNKNKRPKFTVVVNNTDDDDSPKP
jgi:hypothetical protein